MSKVEKVKKPFYKKWWFIAIIAFVIFGAILSPSEEDRENEKVAAEQQKVEDKEKKAVEAAAKEKEKSDSEAAAKVKAEEVEAAMTTEERVNKIIVDKIGETNNMKKERIVESSVFEFTGDPDGEKNIIITLNASENLSNKMTRRGIWMDSVEILEPLSSIKGVENISIEWLFPLVDQLGNESDGRIMLFDFPKETFEKVNWENFNVENLPDVSTGYFEHPALGK